MLGEVSNGSPVTASGRGSLWFLKGAVWGPGARVLLWLASIAASIVLQWPWLTVHDDVRDSIGGLRVGEAGGLSPTDIFIQRPMAYRLLISGLDHLTFGPVVFRERLTLSLAIVFAGLAGAWLARSLRGWLADLPATVTGLAVFAAVAWAPAEAMLQPEWCAVLLCVAGLAAALSGGPAGLVSWRAAALGTGGFLFAVASLQKYTTTTTAVVAWGVILVLSRRRALIVGCWTALLTGVLFGLTTLVPHEWQWFRDMPALEPSTPVSLRLLAWGTWRVACESPVFLLWPAATIYGGLASGRGRRWLWVIGPALVVVVTLTGVVVQRRYYPYHYVALPVFMAGVVALASTQWWRRFGRLPLAVLLVAVGWLPIVDWMGRHSLRWRLHHPTPAVVLMIMGLAALLAGWQSWRVRAANRASQGPVWHLVVVSVSLALIITFPAWPHTPEGYAWVRKSRASEVSRRTSVIEQGSRLHDAAGGATVAYLTLHEGPYFVGLPTRCSYAFAVFLWRASSTRAAETTSFRQNLACLRDPRARFLVVEPSASGWRTLPVVRKTIREQFDCTHPAVRTANYQLCPRR